MRKLTLLTAAVLLLLVAVVAAQEGAVTKPQEKTAVTEEKPAVVEEKKAVETPAMMVEAELCAGIEERMPTGMADSFTPDVGEVYLWCKVTGCMDTTVMHHVWYRNGEQVADVELPVRSPSWRTWSSKKILSSWTGDWEVKVVDADGNEIKSLPFKIAAAE